VAVRRESCGRHAPAFGGAEEKESNTLVLEEDRLNNQHNFVSRARKKLLMKLINFILVFYPLSQLNCPQNDGIALPPQSPPRQISSSPFPPLLCPCCVLLLTFWPPKFTTYFFLSSIFVNLFDNHNDGMASPCTFRPGGVSSLMHPPLLASTIS
jgi:hypothetical protein